MVYYNNGFRKFSRLVAKLNFLIDFPQKTPKQNSYNSSKLHALLFPQKIQQNPKIGMFTKNKNSI